MAHVESGGQAIARLQYSAERHERTVRKADGDEAHIRRADLHHLTTAHNTRRQVRYNGAIDRLDRAVLGTSGSPEVLQRFRELAKDIGFLQLPPCKLLQSLVKPFVNAADGRGRKTRRAAASNSWRARRISAYSRHIFAWQGRDA